MKTLLFIILFIPTIAFSQEKKVTFGIQLGYSSSWSSEKSEIAGPTNKQMSDASSILLGGIVNYKLSESFSIQTELNYVKKGFRRDLSYDDITTKFKRIQEYSFNRLEVPVLVKLSFTKSKMLYFMTGVSPSFNLASKYNADINETKPIPSQSNISLDKIPNLNSFDTPIVFSLGFERPVGSSFLGLQLRYNQSLMNYFDNITSKVSSFNIIAGIRF